MWSVFVTILLRLCGPWFFMTFWGAHNLDHLVPQMTPVNLVTLILVPKTHLSLIVDIVMIYYGICEIQFIHQNKITSLKHQRSFYMFDSISCWTKTTKQLNSTILFHSRNDTSIGRLNCCNGLYQWCLWHRSIMAIWNTLSHRLCKLNVWLCMTM